MNHIAYQLETCKQTLKFFVPIRAQLLFNTILTYVYQWFKTKVKVVP
jgi:hypothetical protein